MKIKIEDIPPQGLHQEANYDPKELDMEIDDHPYSLPVKFSTPIFAIADIHLYDKELVVEVVVTYKLKMVCSRCLDEFEREFEKKFIFNYNTRGLEVIDITSDIRDEIILGYPQKPLCRADCKGICPRCGVNLNTEKCKCQKDNQEVKNGQSQKKTF